MNIGKAIDDLLAQSLSSLSSIARKAKYDQNLRPLR